MIDDLIKKIEQVKKQMEVNLLSLNQEIDQIIKNRDHSSYKIEQLLDILLDYMQMGVGEQTFQRLNSYYSTFNRENAESYDCIRKEMED